MKLFWFVFSSVVFISLATASRFNISKPPINLKKEIYDRLNRITDSEWQEFLSLGIASVEQQKRLETNLLNARITIENGTLSHAQLLETLPNNEGKLDSDIALKILSSSLYVYNSICAQFSINGEECLSFLENKSLPAGSDIFQKCTAIVEGNRKSHHVFRRLLPRHYKDGINEMFTEDHLPLPRFISRAVYAEYSDSKKKTYDIHENTLADEYRNLILVQWSQFIEHDLSKPVTILMSNGEPIECCNRNYNKLQPRFEHPACAPLVLRDELNKYGQQSCLNYVRSALTVGNRCTFGSTEKLNQATGTLDLSQLYGFTDIMEKKMRSFMGGKLKSTVIEGSQRELLPMTADAEAHEFCAVNGKVNISYCFMAGDSRVNNNPLTISIYTIFLRIHNLISKRLSEKYPYWNDEQLFQAAKKINIDIYRRIVMTDWLTEVLGQATVLDIMHSPESRMYGSQDYDISNEFAVAAIRFYFSMMTNSLPNFSSYTNLYGSGLDNNSINIENIFLLKEQFYTPNILYNGNKLDEILESLLNHRAMKMDDSYVGSLVWNGPVSSKPTQIDVLSFDIQRGRDHGLQPYVKYLEICSNVKINGWTDLEAFIPKHRIEKLRDVYKSWANVDLIIGGISENPLSNAAIGPTFHCILTDQFIRIRQHHREQKTELALDDFNNISAADLICLTTNIKFVQKNIFKLISTSNPLIKCDHGL